MIKLFQTKKKRASLRMTLYMISESLTLAEILSILYFITLRNPIPTLLVVQSGAADPEENSKRALVVCTPVLSI